MSGGGPGSDRFYFTSALTSANIDHVTDFVHGIDKLVLEKLRPQPSSTASFRATSGSARTSVSGICQHPQLGRQIQQAHGGTEVPGLEFGSAPERDVGDASQVQGGPGPGSAVQPPNSSISTGFPDKADVSAQANGITSGSSGERAQGTYKG